MTKKRIGMDPFQWIEAIVDLNSFQSINSEEMESNFGDEIVAGIGRCGGRVVCIYAHNQRVDKGFVSSKGSEKICHLMDKAYELGVPIISLMASPGVSISEGILSGDAYTKVITKNVEYSGVIPQIALIFGATMGAAAYSATLMDYVIFNKVRSSLMVTSPGVIKEVMGEETTVRELGGSEVHQKKTGIADFVVKDIPAQISKLKELLSFLPGNNIEDPPRLLKIELN